MGLAIEFDAHGYYPLFHGTLPMSSGCGQVLQCAEALHGAARVVAAANGESDVEGLRTVADGVGLLDGDAVEKRGVRQHVGRINDRVTRNLHVNTRLNGDDSLSVFSFLDGCLRPGMDPQSIECGGHHTLCVLGLLDIQIVGGTDFSDFHRGFLLWAFRRQRRAHAMGEDGHTEAAARVMPGKDVLKMEHMSVSEVLSVIGASIALSYCLSGTQERTGNNNTLKGCLSNLEMAAGTFAVPAAFMLLCVAEMNAQ